MFKRLVNSVIKTNDFNYKSCEMISDDLNNKITEKYPGRKVWIDVSEDGENGAYTEYPNGLMDKVGKYEE